MENGKRTTKTTAQKPIEQYEHKDKQRLNNPPVGLVDAHTDNGGVKKKKYQYDPHLDPQLVWAGKAEHTSFEVPIVSLHVHERIDPRRIIETVRKEDDAPKQMSLFEEQKKPLREAIEFYKHKENWTNRLIAGDSLLVMNSLLEKEGMGGKVQMIYFDPPYGIKYGSNFQPFVNKRDVKDGKDEDLTGEPEMIKAFRDTWELGIHSYLTYLRDRLLLARELLHESGSIFVQISDENVHHVRELMDEVFGAGNFAAFVVFQKTGGQSAKILASVADYLLWYSKNKAETKYRQLFQAKIAGSGVGEQYRFVQLPDGTRRRMMPDELKDTSLLPAGSRVFRPTSVQSDTPSNSTTFEVEINGHRLPAKSWKTTPEGMKRLIQAGRIIASGTRPDYVRYLDDFPVAPLTAVWDDTMGARDLVYVVQTTRGSSSAVS